MPASSNRPNPYCLRCEGTGEIGGDYGLTPSHCDCRGRAHLANLMVTVIADGLGEAFTKMGIPQAKWSEATRFHSGGLVDPNRPAPRLFEPYHPGEFLVTKAQYEALKSNPQVQPYLRDGSESVAKLLNLLVPGDGIEPPTP